MHYLPASLLPWPPACIQRLLPCNRCRVGPCCTSPKPTQLVRSPSRDWHEPRLAYLRQPESRARTTQGPRRSIMLSTSFNCSAVGVPRRRCSSSATRERHSARQTRAALSLMRLFVCCARKIVSQSASATRTPLRTASGASPASARSVGQEGFDALVHRVSPPYRLSA